MYTVLLPLDTSESRARAQAETAAGLPDAANAVAVHLLHVVDDPERARGEVVTETEAGQAAHDRLEGAVARIESMGRYGDPATEILQAAEELDPDLVLLGGRKRSPLGSVLFGSVSQEVTLDAEWPVVVTGGHEERADPTHRCRSCGEEYVTQPDIEITTCQRCGGAKVERLADSADEEGPAPTA